jgi:hypothetical protein
MSSIGFITYNLWDRIRSGARLVFDPTTFDTGKFVFFDSSINILASLRVFLVHQVGFVTFKMKLDRDPSPLLVSTL